jgi:putative transposase
MRPSRFTDDEIVQALRRVKAGTPAVTVCRALGVTQTTFYRWRRKYERDETRQPGDVGALRLENQKLKELVANMMLARMP